MDLQCLCFFFFNDTATTEIYTLSLHDALPICVRVDGSSRALRRPERRNLHEDPDAVRRFAGLHQALEVVLPARRGDRKSTRLNSSHLVISYAVFCLKKKKSSSSKQGLARRLTQ